MTVFADRLAKFKHRYPNAELATSNTKTNRYRIISELTSIIEPNKIPIIFALTPDNFLLLKNYLKDNFSDLEPVDVETAAALIRLDIARYVEAARYLNNHPEADPNKNSEVNEAIKESLKLIKKLTAKINTGAQGELKKRLVRRNNIGILKQLFGIEHALESTIVENDKSRPKPETSFLIKNAAFWYEAMSGEKPTYSTKLVTERNNGEFIDGPFISLVRLIFQIIDMQFDLPHKLGVNENKEQKDLKEAVRNVLSNMPKN